MADITFTAVEAAIVTKLKSAITYVEDRNIASYAGQIEDANNGLPVEAPSLFVMFDGFECSEENMSAKGHEGVAQFAVLVVADSYKGGTNPRTNTTNGAYKMIDDTITALDDDSLSISGFNGLTFTGIEMITVSSLRSMYKVKFNAYLEVSR